MPPVLLRLPPARGDPSATIGHVPKTAVVRWTSELGFAATSPESDDAVRLTGDDGAEGYRPSTLLLAALAACTAMDVVSIAAKKRQAVTSYEVVATGEQRETHPKTFATIVVEHRFTGTDLDAGALARCVELSATRYCLVNAHLSMGDVTIEHRCRIRRNGDAPRDSDTAGAQTTGTHGDSGAAGDSDAQGDSGADGDPDVLVVTTGPRGRGLQSR